MVDALVRQAAVPVPETETASAHEHWVAALRAPDDTLLGTDASLEALAAQVRSWQRPVVGAAAAPFRLTVRLEEPRGGRTDEAARRSDPGTSATCSSRTRTRACSSPPSRRGSAARS